MSCFKILLLNFIVLFSTQLAKAQFFGVSVNHYKGDVVRRDQGYHSHQIHLTVLAVYPQPKAAHINDVYTGIDIEPLTPIILKEGYFGVNRISHYFMSVIQNAYYQIAETRGMLTMGSPFQKELASKEPFWDGRSAAIGLFEGNDFSHPLATFRVSFATPQNPQRPLEVRLHIKLSDYRNEAAVRAIQINDLEAALGLDFSGQAVVNQFSQMLDRSTDPGSLFFKNIMKRLAPAVRTGHKFLLPGGQLVPFTAVLEAGQKQAEKENIMMPFLVDGGSAELKGLSQVQNNRKVDYLHFLFQQAVKRGFFDVVPYLNGYTMPTNFVAETPLGHVGKEYKQWPWKILHTIYDPIFKGEVAVVELERHQLGALLPVFFTRATEGVFFNPGPVDSETFDKALMRSEAETLALDESIPPVYVDPSKITEHPYSCREAVGSP